MMVGANNQWRVFGGGRCERCSKVGDVRRLEVFRDRRCSEAGVVRGVRSSEVGGVQRWEVFGGGRPGVLRARLLFRTP